MREGFLDRPARGTRVGKMTFEQTAEQRFFGQLRSLANCSLPSVMRICGSTITIASIDDSISPRVYS